ncbi:hypothetical protein DPMN_120676 [Dreissena polymorpha]|uniref:Uncharacterized protein n=1 Tax=Dreissena polymorpha TaxID=45954 RepID=A0A9D4GL99_DREPO|nr:hypothetical protein DPMN_120676 [Dreissena polymorpha]
MHSDVQFFINEYVAVSYQDNWYPGMVQKVAKDLKTLTVNFLARSNNTGHFIWPNRKDEQEVNTQFILSHGFMPDSKHSGRLWFISEHADITTSYEKFSRVFF